ncbi:RNA polymerase sigma-70 factor (ECF subfamily) [Kribbella sp. VKM Ac-2571]|uniref:RNA polymerase sigma factor SigJ n=1 Tax=Kribbella sp. VKM Ac-2571 TaxID=2512222 RepID=UPI00105BB892|nr:RNA polymerase sigma factor SigJ [Kribbella sp. VKM Ac-2571]TDO55384.1 RNA polymerase sigma-70 factor (ECF subfamily) [Kribbella sp. VKM Ac-2571]
MDDFERLRGRLFGIAYRMTGTATDAEEILQDAWLRWQDADRATVRDPNAYLAKIVTNLSIKQLTSARARRELYVGQWLPEPVLTGSGFDELGPLEVVSERESVSFALLLLLERLTPAERAVYVLHEAFAYGYREVAELIGTSEANARQLASRAGKKLSAEGPRQQPVDNAGWRKLVERFIAAARLGEIEELEKLLAEDVVSRADSGGKVSAARNVLVGRDRVARYVSGALQRFGGGIEAHLAEANGGPALLAVGPGGIVAICFIGVGPDGVTDLQFVMNPDKLTFAVAQLSHIEGLPDLTW